MWTIPIGGEVDHGRGRLGIENPDRQTITETSRNPMSHVQERITKDRQKWEEDVNSGYVVFWVQGAHPIGRASCGARVCVAMKSNGVTFLRQMMESAKKKSHEIAQRQIPFIIDSETSRC